MEIERLGSMWAVSLFRSSSLKTEEGGREGVERESVVSDSTVEPLGSSNGPVKGPRDSTTTPSRWPNPVHRPAQGFEFPLHDGSQYFPTNLYSTLKSNPLLFSK